MKNAFFSESNPGGREVIPKFLSPLLIRVTIKHVTPVTISAIIEINAPSLNAPLAPAGRPVITPTAVPFAAALSRVPLLILPRPPCDGCRDLLGDPRFPLLPLVALTRHTPDLIAHATGTARPSLIKTISTSTKTSLEMESVTLDSGRGKRRLQSSERTRDP